MTPDERPARPPEEPPEPPVFSPGPWSRGLLYSLFAVAALAYGHYSGQRPLTPFKAVALGAFAILAGVVIALLQNWARNAAVDRVDTHGNRDSTEI